MARSFNGSGDKINITGSIVGNGVFTISVWAYPASTSAGAHNIFASGIFAYIVQLRREGGDYNFYRFDGTDDLAQWAGGVSVNTWQHLGATYDGTNIRIFNGGVLRGGPTASGVGASAGTNNSIGNDDIDAGGNIQYWDGRIADVAVWNIVLTANELAALGAGIRPYMIRPLSITAYWPLDGIASPEPDLSSHILNGTLTGTAIAEGPPMTLFTPKPLTQFDLPTPTAAQIYAFDQMGAHITRKIRNIGY